MTCRPRINGAEVLFDIAVMQNGDETIIELDFARSPRGWDSIKTGMEKTVVFLQERLKNQGRCPARPKS